METNPVFTVIDVLRIVEARYRQVGLDFDKKKRQFGCLQLWGVPSAHPLRLTIPFGTIPGGSRCYDLAQEKVARLRCYPDHWSSFQSRDLKQDKYGGAIRLPESSKVIGYMAWSGFPELVDEALVCAVAVRANLMKREHALAIADLSANHEMLPVLAALGV